MTVNIETEEAKREAVVNEAREKARAWGEAAAMGEDAPAGLKSWMVDEGFLALWEWGKNSPEEAQRFAIDVAGGSEPRAQGERACAGMAWLGALASSEEEMPIWSEVEVSWETPGEREYPMKNTSDTIDFDRQAYLSWPSAVAPCVIEAFDKACERHDFDNEEEGAVPGYEILDGAAGSMKLSASWAAGMDWVRVGEAVGRAFERSVLLGAVAGEQAPAARAPRI